MPGDQSQIGWLKQFQIKLVTLHSTPVHSSHICLVSEQVTSDEITCVVSWCRPPQGPRPPACNITAWSFSPVSSSRVAISHIYTEEHPPRLSHYHTIATGNMFIAVGCSDWKHWICICSQYSWRQFCLSQYSFRLCRLEKCASIDGSVFQNPKRL